MSKLRQVPSKYDPARFDIHCDVAGCESVTREPRLRKDRWLQVKVVGPKGIGTLNINVCKLHHEMMALDEEMVASALDEGLKAIFLKQESENELS